MQKSQTPSLREQSLVLCATKAMHYSLTPVGMTIQHTCLGLVAGLGGESTPPNDALPSPAAGVEGRGGLKRTRLALGGGLSGGWGRLAAWLRMCSTLLALSIRMGMGEAATGLCVLPRNPPMDCRWGSDCLSKMDGPLNGSRQLQTHM